MDVKKIILQVLERQPEVRTAEITKKTGFSRAYVNRFFRELEQEGVVVKIGRANQSRYVRADKESIRASKKNELVFHRIFRQERPGEDLVWKDIGWTTGILDGLPKNVQSILNFAFTEMLNNALEHALAQKIEVWMKRADERIFFEVIDDGVGIFANIKQKFKLASELDGINHLLKGKQTTNVKFHSGEGIFFSSKLADKMLIQSHKKMLFFNNKIADIFIKDVRQTKGTKVVFTIAINAKTNISRVFRQFTDDNYEFSKTRIVIKLYKYGTDLISRSQARRLVVGLEKFKQVILDFSGVETVGQAFADEIFRVWSNRFPKIRIETVKANDNVRFMIKRIGS